MSQFKNQREVLEALLRGDKVTSIKWRSGEFIYIDEDGMVIDEVGDSVFIPKYKNAKIYTPPKKKVTKTIERWANVYREGLSVYRSESEANESSHISRIACVKLTGTYEVEE